MEGIGKLIELLNEFETPRSGVVFKSYDDYDGTFYGVDCDGETEIAWSDSFVCGKRFQWIKWLVDNDKIDLDMVREKLGIPCCVWYGSGRIIAVKDVEDYKQVLMLLSISDTPIEDLISYLK